MPVRAPQDASSATAGQAAKPIPLVARLLGGMLVLFLLACGVYAILGEHWVGKARFPFRDVSLDGHAALSLGWVFVALATVPATLLMPNQRWAARWGVLAFFAVIGAVVLAVKR
jgi:hypothetical protein